MYNGYGGKMTNKELAKHIVHQKNEIDQLPDLPAQIRDSFDDEKLQEQVYHSSQMEGSTVKLKDIQEMV